jgi:hypothetical protein
MPNVIQQSVEFEKATPEELFDILMDPQKHSEIIKAEVKINRRRVFVGGSEGGRADSADP